MVTKKKTSKRLNPEWREEVMHRERVDARFGDIEMMKTPKEHRREKEAKLHSFFTARKQNPNNQAHEQPSTAQCRKIGCRELTENPFTRHQMICGLERCIPGYLEECPKGVY